MVGKKDVEMDEYGNEVEHDDDLNQDEDDSDDHDENPKDSGEDAKTELEKPAKKKRKKRRKKDEHVVEIHPLDQFGKVAKAFIVEYIRTIEYHDLAKILGIKASDLKIAVEKMGIKLPIDRAKKWSEIDVGTFRSLSACARCQVQRNHSSFLVGINVCRKCYEENILHWIENEIMIDIQLPVRS